MRVVALASVVAIGLLAADARAGSAPLILENAASVKLRVRVAAGTVAPCTSSANTQLLDVTLLPAGSLQVATDAECVCVEHASEPFTQVGWSTSQIRCRPIVCPTKHTCRRDMTVPIRIVLP